MGEYDEIEVRSRYTGDWAGGFELHDADPDDGDPRFKVRRRSDGTVLPDWFDAREIRPPQTPRDAGHGPSTG